MKQEGYYRNPTLGKDKVVFVADDDLWQVPLAGGKAERLTAGTGEAKDPALSPDGKWLAFTGTYEGHPEVYLMPSEGGQSERLTFISEGSMVVGWTHEGEIIFSSLKNHPFRLHSLYTVCPTTRAITTIPCGPANLISYNPKSKGCVIQRHGHGYVSWKRYRGGTAGELWIDQKGNGDFQKLIDIEGNALCPLWIQDRIYFISDHQGHGNIYSCTPEGKDLKRHTSHEDFFVRGLNSNGKTLVYTAGGDLYRLPLNQAKSEKIKVDFLSSFSQRARKFVSPTHYLSSYSLNKTGTQLAVVTRGRPFSFANWEGAVHQYGERDGIRYRTIRWLHDDLRVLIVSDRDGQIQLEIHPTDPTKSPKILKKMDLGRILSLEPSPKEDEIVLTNHRCELIHVNLKTQKTKVIEKSVFGDISGINWSPDGKWVVYDCPLDERHRAIKLCEIKGFKTHTITKPLLDDFKPCFDPEGKYIYFLSKRSFSPFSDTLQFEYCFPKGIKPYLILLDETLPSPFIPQLQSAEPPKPEKEKKGKNKTEPKGIKIDLKGIKDRILEFPVPEGDYISIAAIPGKALFLSYPLETVLKSDQHEPQSRGHLHSYDFATQREDTIISKISSFDLSGNYQWLCYYGSKRLRVVRAGEKPQDQDPSYRKGGWIDLSRIKVSISPPQEWAQIFDEVWRLQKDFFWTEDMSKINWDEIYKRYRPLVERLATRNELTDLIAEMHGELGTSHAYVFGGDVRHSAYYPLGDLGADFKYDKSKKGYVISNIVQGDRWSPDHTSPLNTPGLGIKEGDVVLEVNGQRVDAKTTPESLLVNQARNAVSLLVKSGKDKPRKVFVKTLASQTAARYRDWVEKNRAYVHKKTKGKVGYIHIPDMVVTGFAEFHRSFLSELDREGLIVDVRFNRGGNVSGLLLEKLSRKRLGYDKTRWYGVVPYPYDSPRGPMVGLANEYAASDGDIFSHSFKMLKLGPLIGKRTWGGVIGIWPRHSLLDGGTASQPEFSFWFHDVGWAVENYGVAPDIEVEITPQDYEKEKDPQLDRGIEEVLKIIKENPEQKPFQHERPDLSPPRLKRTRS